MHQSTRNDGIRRPFRCNLIQQTLVFPGENNRTNGHTTYISFMVNIIPLASMKLVENQLKRQVSLPYRPFQKTHVIINSTHFISQKKMCTQAWLQEIYLEDWGEENIFHLCQLVSDGTSCKGWPLRFLSIILHARETCLPTTKTNAFPLPPAPLAVLPTRRTYSLRSRGKSNWMT